MIQTLAQPALAKNAGRRYPLLDDVETGIPDDALIDCHVVTTVVVSPTNVAVTAISGTADAATATVSIDVDGHAITIRATPGRLASGTSEDGAATAWIVVGDGVAGLSFAGRALLVPTAVACDARRVRSVRALTSTLEPDDVAVYGRTQGTATALSGVVDVVSGYNVDAALVNGRVRLHVSNGGGLGAYCRPVGGHQTCGGVLYSINGELPDKDGNVVIVGGAGVSVSTGGAHEIVVSVSDAVFDTLAENCI